MYLTKLSIILTVTHNSTFTFHIQCPWRLVINHTIFLGSGDIFIPSSEFVGEWEEFEWDRNGNNLFDERINNYDYINLYPLIIDKIDIRLFGDIVIRFRCGSYLELFTNNAAKEEQWRFYRMDIEREHIVVTPYGIDES